MIHPKIHRCLHQNAIKKLLDDKKINISDEAEKHCIDLETDLPYSKLLDAIAEKYFTVEEINNFLLDELNYGRIKNIYISKIEDVSHLDTEEKVLKYICGLKTYHYGNCENLREPYFITDLQRGITYGEKKLLYVSINKDENGELKFINLLLGECIRNPDNGTESNNYYPVIIDINDKMLIIRAKNWGKEFEDTAVDKSYKKIVGIIRSVFSLRLHQMTVIAQTTAYSLISNLVNSVVEEPMKMVNDKLFYSVDKQVKMWAQDILSKSNNLTPSDVNVLVQVILNNYCKYYMVRELKAVKVKDFKEKYGVEGYPRYIRFIDDTVGEGRAKSADSKESLLETSLFYDIKARLDQAKSIKLMQIYWTTCPVNDWFGISIKTDIQGCLKVTFLPHHYNKEMYEYVLRKIKEHIPA